MTLESVAAGPALTLVILGAPRTKKNHGQVIWRRDKKGRNRQYHVPSAAYQAWATYAQLQLARGQQLPLGDYNCAATFYRDAARGDAVGYYQALAEWRERQGYAGPWLFYSRHADNRRATWSAQSLWLALMKAAQRAKVEHRERRGAHGLRLVAGEVAAITGDFLLGLRAIGDTDPRRATEYIKTRQDRIGEAFAALDRRAPKPEARPNAQPSRNAVPNDEGRPDKAPRVSASSVEGTDDDR